MLIVTLSYLEYSVVMYLYIYIVEIKYYCISKWNFSAKILVNPRVLAELINISQYVSTKKKLLLHWY